MDGAAGESGWERAKVELRVLEGDIETHLIQLDNIGVGSDGSEVQAMCKEVGRLVAALKARVRALGEQAEKAQGVQAASMRQQLERYEQVVAEKERALAHVMQTQASRRSRHQLLADVKNDIEEYTEAHSTRLLHAEADHIARATADAQRLQAMAGASHQQMKDQHSVFVRAADRAASIVGMAPGIDGILSKIAAKRQKDTIILAVLIAVCMFLMWYFW